MIGQRRLADHHEHDSDGTHAQRQQGAMGSQHNAPQRDAAKAQRRGRAERQAGERRRWRLNIADGHIDGDSSGRYGGAAAVTFPCAAALSGSPWLASVDLGKFRFRHARLDGARDGVEILALQQNPDPHLACMLQWLYAHE